MQIEEVLALYDREQRMVEKDPDFRQEITAEVTRSIHNHSPSAWIIYSRLTPDNIERVIEEQIDYFEALGRDFEWKVYTHDWPPDLVELLAARGFEVGEVEALMVLDLETAPARLFEPPRHAVRKLEHIADLEGVAQVKTAVWGDDSSWLMDELAAGMQNNPDLLEVYVAEVDGRTVSAAWIRFAQGTHFASLWGGSTLPEYRGQGIYHDLVAVRAQQARRRGFRYLTVDASPMSRPILEKLGFVAISQTYPCEWKVQQPKQV